jgi:hypothetical protein
MARRKAAVRCETGRKVRNARVFRRAIPLTRMSGLPDMRHGKVEGAPRVSNNRGDDARSFRDARNVREPGIHNPELWLWIPGSSASRTPRNDEWVEIDPAPTPA